MRYIVSALILMIVLSSGALADDWNGTFINQTNDQEATAGTTPLIPGSTYMNGDVQERAANWAVVVGDQNYLYQGNEQYGGSAGGTAQAEGTNLAMIVGNGNDVYQGNDAHNFGIETDPLQMPGSSALTTINQMNGLIIMGDYNYVDKSNVQEANLTAYSESIDPEQSSFGMILGDNNTLIQSNTVHNESNNGFEGIYQMQDNAAYIFGFNNYINQSNIANAKIEVESPLSQPSISQTESNLAFAISACDTPEFAPLCGNTTMSQPCPEIPAPPAAPAFPLTDYPLDP